ncbi:hypothetical protein HYH03_010628 [Edaphochlamys debaryana]|uniref:ThuA-like domain-containing protein n=1 Tax=Edaphochlamys debaryana TaxID=47281 RepID=A0A835XVK1_9CHLO|nr:hypothetical protein HYH03_010628 [Edaphochlamys debaryana]|eukprot:KAG2490951.1 hypothetical protein HYH03_010628 [Edaphochlamys debaryana]
MAQMSLRSPACAGLVLVALLAGCSAALASPRVGLFMSDRTGVLDFNWDNGPANLKNQLKQLTSELQIVDAPSNKLDAFVVPPQNGHTFYSSAEDMDAVASFVAQGGLVILHDANHGQGQAAREFIAKALGYDGRWASCKVLGSNAKADFGLPELSNHAYNFLATETAWPAALEDAATTTVSTWCRHEDESATSVPLYTVQGDDMKTVVQAFGKAGVSGAVVVVSYSWKDGTQEQWGLLLKKLIDDFAAGAYTAPAQGNSADHPGLFDSVLETAAGASDAAAEVVRRFLQGSVGTYPAPVYPSPPSTPNVIIVQPPPPPSPPKDTVFPSPSTPVASPSPSPPPATPPSPMGVPVAATELPFADMPAFGAKGRTKRLVWANDVNFTAQIQPKKPLQLVDRNKTDCGPACKACKWAWKATNNSRSVAVFFKDPVLINRIYIMQTRNTGVIRVQTIKWTYPPQGLSSDKYLSGTIYDVPSDPTKCKSVLEITNLTATDAGLDLPVPTDPMYNQANLPAEFQTKAVGGILITILRNPLSGTAPKPTSGKNYGPFLEWVHFDGKVIYPQDTSIYTPYMPTQA